MENLDDNAWTHIDTLLLIWFLLKLLFSLFDFSRDQIVNDACEILDTQSDDSVSDINIPGLPSKEIPAETRAHTSNEGAGSSIASTPQVSGRRTWGSEDDETSPIRLTLSPPSPSKEPAIDKKQSDLHQCRDQFTFPPPLQRHRRSKSLGDALDLPSLTFNRLTSQEDRITDRTAIKSEEDRLAKGAKLIVDAIQILLPSFNRSSSGSTPHSQASLKAIALALSPLLKPSPAHLHNNPIFNHATTSFISAVPPSPSPLPPLAAGLPIPIALRFED